MIPHNEMYTTCQWAHQAVTTGEWQCWYCHQWHYTWQTDTGDRQTVRIYDRDPDPNAITAYTQVAITHACQYLATRGKRYLIDYGYDNAIALAESLGWQVPPSLGITHKAGDTYGF